MRFTWLGILRLRYRLSTKLVSVPSEGTFIMKREYNL
jgi:hypothetical protein